MGSLPPTLTGGQRHFPGLGVRGRGDPVTWGISETDEEVWGARGPVGGTEPREGHAWAYQGRRGRTGTQPSRVRPVRVPQGAAGPLSASIPPPSPAKWVLSDPGHSHGDLRYATDPCRASRPSLPGDGALGGEVAAGTHRGVVDEHCPQRGNGEAAALGPCAMHSLCPPAAGAPPRGSLLLAPQRLHTERAEVCKARGALIHTLPKAGTPSHPKASPKQPRGRPDQHS